MTSFRQGHLPSYEKEGEQKSCTKLCVEWHGNLASEESE